MVTRVQRTLVDDLDASVDGVGTYQFALEGVEYEIDLSEANLQQLRSALAPFTTAGRRLPKYRTIKPGRGAGPQSNTAPVRRWWADHAQTHQLPPWRANGPIPGPVRDAYRRAHPTGTR